MKKYILLSILILFASFVTSNGLYASSNTNEGSVKIKIKSTKKAIVEGSDLTFKWETYKGDVDTYMVVLQNKLVPGLETSGIILSPESTSVTYNGESLNDKTVEFWNLNSNTRDEAKIRKNFFVSIYVQKNGEKFLKGKSPTFTIEKLKANKDKSGVTKDDHFLTGNISSEVKVVTYSDIQCPFCKQFNNTINELSKEYGDRIAFVFRHFPLSVIHENAMLAANATECVASQIGENSFGTYLNKVFESQSDLSKATLSRLAVELGMNKKTFESCLEKETYSKRIDRDIKLAEKMSKNDAVNGVPTSFVYGPNGKKVTISGAQSYSEVKEILDN